MIVTLEIADDLGGERQIGFVRSDLKHAKIFHTIVRAPAGAAFTVDEHFKTCEVCREHGVTQDCFHSFIMERLS